MILNNEYRTKSPPGVSKEETASDAPAILHLFDQTSEITVYTASSPYWEAVREVFNLAVHTQPIAIVRPTSEAAVSVVIHFCSLRKIPISIRNSGHDFDGRNLVSGGVVLDLRSLDWVKVAEDRETVRVGGGVAGGKLLRFLESHDLFTPTGFCSTVGYTGWAVGGGYGSYTGLYGLGADQIVAARLATVDGKVVDTEVDDDLLWAVRGAANGNLGVIVELQVKLYPKPSLLAGMVAFSAKEIKEVLGRFQSFCEAEFPNNFSGDCIYVRAPDGNPLFIFIWSWVAPDGNLRPGWYHLAKTKSLGTVVSDTVAETSPVGFSDVMERVIPPPSLFRFRSRTVDQFSPGLAEVFIQNQPPAGGSHIIIHNCHGEALKENTTSVFANRSPHLVLGIGGLASRGTPLDSTDMKLAIEWANVIANEITKQGLASSKGYANFTLDADMNTVRFFGQEATGRLQAVKRKYDPENVFFRGYPRIE